MGFKKTITKEHVDILQDLLIKYKRCNDLSTVYTDKDFIIGKNDDYYHLIINNGKGDIRLLTFNYITESNDSTDLFLNTFNLKDNGDIVYLISDDGTKFFNFNLISTNDIIGHVYSRETLFDEWIDDYKMIIPHDWKKDFDELLNSNYSNTEKIDKLLKCLG